VTGMPGDENALIDDLIQRMVSGRSAEGGLAPKSMDTASP